MTAESLEALIEEVLALDGQAQVLRGQGSLRGEIERLRVGVDEPGLLRWLDGLDGRLGVPKEA